MCLAIPGRITRIEEGDSPARPGRVDCGGVTREVSLAMTPDAGVGDYVLIHAGCSISVIDEAEAESTLAALLELAEAEMEPDEAR